jgi:hypothetical protein
MKKVRDEHQESNMSGCFGKENNRDAKPKIIQVNDLSEARFKLEDDKDYF